MLLRSWSTAASAANAFASTDGMTNVATPNTSVKKTRLLDAPITEAITSAG